MTRDSSTDIKQNAANTVSFLTASRSLALNRSVLAQKMESEISRMTMNATLAVQKAVRRNSDEYEIIASSPPSNGPKVQPTFWPIRRRPYASNRLLGSTRSATMALEAGSNDPKKLLPTISRPMTW